MQVFALSLDREGVGSMLAYLQEYRGMLLTRLAPSPERNFRQRLLQGLQGRLLQADRLAAQEKILQFGREVTPGSVSLPLSAEEIAALKMLAVDLAALQTRQGESETSSRIRSDLAVLQGALEQLAPATFARYAPGERVQE